MSRGPTWEACLRSFWCEGRHSTGMDEPLDVVPIEDDDDLYRRLFARYVKADGSVSSAAYKDRRKKPLNKISVDLARFSTPEETRARDDRGFRVAAVRAGAVRDLEFSVRHDPMPENFAHSLIEGENTMEKCLELATATVVVL